MNKQLRRGLNTSPETQRSTAAALKAPAICRLLCECLLVYSSGGGYKGLWVLAVLPRLAWNLCPQVISPASASLSSCHDRPVSPRPAGGSFCGDPARQVQLLAPLHGWCPEESWPGHPAMSTYVMRWREQSQNSISMASSCLDSPVSLFRHSKKSFNPPWGPSSQINAHSLGSRSSRYVRPGKGQKAKLQAGTPAALRLPPFQWNAQHLGQCARQGASTPKSRHSRGS